MLLREAAPPKLLTSFENWRGPAGRCHQQVMPFLSLREIYAPRQTAPGGMLALPRTRHHSPTSLDTLKIPRPDVLSCFLTSGLGWGFRCQAAARREIYGPVISSRQQKAVVTWWEQSPGREGHEEGCWSAPGITCAHTVPRGRWTGPRVGNRNALWVLGKQHHPHECSECNHLPARVVLAYG